MLANALRCVRIAGRTLRATERAAEPKMYGVSLEAIVVIVYGHCVVGNGLRGAAMQVDWIFVRSRARERG